MKLVKRLSLIFLILATTQIKAQNDSLNNLLFEAVKNKNIDKVKSLVEKGADINAKDTAFDAPVINYAAHSGNYEIMKYLIDKGANIHAVNKYNENASYYAAGKNIKSFKLLLNKGIDIKNKSIDGFICLHYAAKHGKTDVVKLILENGIDVNTKTKQGWTALYYAAGGGHLETLIELFNYTKQVDIVSENNWTPLHNAAKNGHADVINLLLKHGASIDAQNADGWTPLMLASYNNQRKAVKVLLKHGANASIKNNEGKTAFELIGKGKYSLLSSAALQGDNELIQLLIKHGTDLNFKTNGIAPLHFACYKKTNYETVKLLLSAGANINIEADQSKLTPLAVAITKGCDSIAELLLRKGADPNVKMKSDGTALHFAAREGNNKIINLLLEYGADINAKSGNRLKTALMIAVTKQHVETVKLLVEKGANINYTSKNDYTSLHLAVGFDNPEIVKVLLQNGASPNFIVKNKKIRGATPLMIAAIGNNIEYTRLLLEYGADKNSTNLLNETAFDIAKKNKNYIVIEFLTNLRKAKKKYAALIATENAEFKKIQKLIKKQKNIDLSYNNGNTLLHYGAKFNEPELVKLLIEKGADKSIINDDKQTPLELAMSNKSDKVIEVLKNKQ